VREIIRSLAITASVSTAVGLFLSEFNISFLKSFLFATIVQFIGWYAFTYYNQVKVMTKNQEINTQIAQEMAKQTAELPCAMCGEGNSVVIRLDDDNDFMCIACNKPNAVYIDIETVSKTQPVNMPEDI